MASARKYRAAAATVTEQYISSYIQTAQLCGGLYRVNAHRRANGRAVPYLPGEIHFFAAYIIPEDTCYIIPLQATRGVSGLLFRRRSDRRPGLYDAYREAWHLLRPE